MPRHLGRMALCFLLLAPTSTQASDGIDEILARPVSPGTLAMLLAYTSDPRAGTRWVEALHHNDPHVRAAAARLLHVSWVAPALPQLRQALADEKDVRAAMEIARAVIAFGTPEDDSAVIDAGVRLKNDELAVIVASQRKTAAMLQIAKFMSIALNETALWRIVPAIVGGDPDALDRIAQESIASSNVAWWNATLQAAVDRTLPIRAERLDAALRQEPLAEGTWWYVAVAASATGFAAPSVQPRLNIPATSSPEAAFGRELAARALKAEPLPQPDFVARVHDGAALQMPQFAAARLATSLRPLLTKPERKALGIEDVRAVTLPPLPADASPYSQIHTIADLPEGFAADVLSQTGCTGNDSQDLAGAVVRFEGTKLAKLQWIATTLTPPCTLAARYLTVASLVPAWSHAEGKEELVLLPMHQTYLQCLSAVEAPDVPPSGYYQIAKGHILPPKKIRNVPPTYPPVAVASRIQGIVVIESQISRSGCVQQSRILQHVKLELDIAALRAVTDWSFTPTLLDGKPVPIVMTVTVQFKLQ